MVFLIAQREARFRRRPRPLVLMGLICLCGAGLHHVKNETTTAPASSCRCRCRTQPSMTPAGRGALVGELRPSGGGKRSSAAARGRRGECPGAARGGGAALARRRRAPARATPEAGRRPRTGASFHGWSDRARFFGSPVVVSYALQQPGSSNVAYVNDHPTFLEDSFHLPAACMLSVRCYKLIIDSTHLTMTLSQVPCQTDPHGARNGGMNGVHHRGMNRLYSCSSRLNLETLSTGPLQAQDPVSSRMGSAFAASARCPHLSGLRFCSFSSSTIFLARDVHNRVVDAQTFAP